MASDSGEPTRRKHHRSSSPEDTEERSKRRKHRHSRRHRHHHHHHRSKKDKEETTEMIPEEEFVEGGKLEFEERKSENNGDEGRGDAVGEILVSSGLGLSGVDYDMEEGEIVDDDGLVGGKFNKSKKSLDSDVESGEIEPNGYRDDSNMGLNEEKVERVDKKSWVSGKDGMGGKEDGEMDQEIASGSEVLANSDYTHKYHKDDDGLLHGDDKTSKGSDGEVERRSRRISSSFEKRRKAISPSHSRDKYLNECSRGNLSKSPERSRVRSRSRSILQEASTIGRPHKTEDPYYLERKHRSESDDERMITQDRKHRCSSRDDGRDKERERSSSRYSDRTERHYDKETLQRYKESSRERDWDRIRDKEREDDRKRDRERARLRDVDRSEREKERETLKERERERDRERERGRERERERERDRVREERNRGRDRGREGDRDGGRARTRDKDRDNDSDRLSGRQKNDYDNDGYRYRDTNSRHVRNPEEYYKDRSRRSDVENESLKVNLEEKDNENLNREDDKLEDYQESITMQLAEQEEDDLERIKEESRRRRQAILEKYKNIHKNETQSQVTVKEKVGRSLEQVPSAEPNIGNTDSQVEGAEIYVSEPSFSVGKSPYHNGLSALERHTGTGGLGEGTPKSERGDDMFCDDIFGESPAGLRKMGKGDGVAVENSLLNDNWDDAEGYYGYRFGEILDGRYEIIAAHGKGVFSTVVRARDLKVKPGHPEEVAIKIIRNNETMYKAGMEELVILKKLVGADPENRRHCVRFLSTFKYRNHLCLVFESLHMNLREVLKKFGRNIGLKLTAVRAYAKQLFIALKHLKNCGVLHCDIKPDNMLVNEAKNVLKLCDFGNAMFAGKNEITPYLVSRFYRAPEIILGLAYDHPMDIWSVGCCLFELYTGKVLFPGATNNDMLRLHMELKGPFPKKMLRKGGFTDQHFDQDLNFLATEEDPVTKKAIRRLLVNIKPKDFGTLISGSPGEDQKMVANFKDLMEKTFVLDPDKRLTVSQALSHPFITGK